MSTREGFTDQKPRIATKQECETRWNGLPSGHGFRCYLCGHRFVEGDYWRWVYVGGSVKFTDEEGKTWGVMNFKTCKSCDGEDVIARWLDHNREFNSPKFWALR